MGIDIHISMRPAAWQGPPPFEDFFTSDFYDAHPEWRCLDRDGTPVTRMSFAIAEVRQHLLGIFREVLRADPREVQVVYRLARAVHESESARAALPLYERAAREDGQNPMPHYYLGYLYKEKSQRARAVQEFRRYLALKPDADEKKDILAEIEDLQPR
jgi:cytochrome c-type biogenesis protein CcmH/NrfG